MASKRRKNINRRRNEQRRIAVRSVRRDPPDIRKLSKALIALAMAEAEREAQAEQAAHKTSSNAATSGQPQKGGATNA